MPIFPLKSKTPFLPLDAPAKIHRDLAANVVDIDRVQPWEANPRQGDVGAISVSLSEYGQTKPIVVQRASGRIIAGNHTWQAAKALEWTKIAVAFVDLDDATAEEYATVDNRTSDRASYDEELQVAVLRRIQERGRLEAVGFDDDDLNTLVERVAGMGPLAAEQGDDDDVPEKYAVVVYCTSETAQGELLERLMSEGFECRALIS